MFCTIINLPFERISITEHNTKKEAEIQFNKDKEGYQKELFNGIALVHIEVLEENGEWKWK